MNILLWAWLIINYILFALLIWADWYEDRNSRPVIDSNNISISECLYREFADAIANALNAMNDLPDFQKISDTRDDGYKNYAMIDSLNIWLDEIYKPKR